MAEGVAVKVKEQNYRGKSLAELKQMDVREVAKFLPSRSRRAILRHFDVIEKFLARSQVKAGRKKKMKTHNRDLVIVPHMVGMTIGVHMGRGFEDVAVTHEMIGHRLGEFALTRKTVKHGSAGLGATKSSRAEKK